MQNPDYIITGMGCAGLSLAARMVASGKFSDKEILLIDKDSKESNDRTWCFWENRPGFFDPVVYRSWKKVEVHNSRVSLDLPLDPYSYKMIRGKDFYAYNLRILKGQPNFKIIHASVERIDPAGKVTTTDGQEFKAPLIFNSILGDKPVLGKKSIWLLQHFKGWIIETSAPCFDPDTARLMDFRVDQAPGTAFVYVMPFSPNKALVEYTLFSPALLEPEAYDAGLKKYISDHITKEGYTVLDEEFGVIPMTDHRFSPGEGAIVNLGTAGGQTKGSSGYTFQFIQKSTARIVDLLIQGKTDQLRRSPNRKFHFYDRVLLDVLKEDRMAGNEVFTRMFEKNKTATVFKFLDNETGIFEDASVILSLPVAPFLRAAMHQLF